jgi:ribosomal protein L40E
MALRTNTGVSKIQTEKKIDVRCYFDNKQHALCCRKTMAF